MKLKLAVLAGSLAFAGSAHAQIAYSSFLPGHQWDQSVGFGINGLGAPPKFIQSFAIGFEAGASGAVDDIYVAVGFLGLGNGREVRLELYEDDGSQQAMGAQIDTWQFTNTAPNNLGQLFHIDNVGSASLTQGNWYWMHMIAVDEDGFHTWMYGDINILAPGLISHDGGMTFGYSPVNNAPAFEITVVPEPATWIGLGIGVLLFARRRK